MEQYYGVSARKARDPEQWRATVQPPGRNTVDGLQQKYFPADKLSLASGTFAESAFPRFLGYQ